MTYYLENRVELSLDYDADEDILYAWVGPVPRPAISYETDEGHVVRLDPETHEFVGVTIFDFDARWNGKPIQLEWPSDGLSGAPETKRRERRVLQPA